MKPLHVNPRGMTSFFEKPKLLLSFIFLSSLAGICSSSATDINREPWHWSSKLPINILPEHPPATKREPGAFDHLQINVHTSMKDLVSKIGVPDAFAPQFFVTQTEGVPVGHVKDGPEAGTFRYVLSNSGEVFISVADFHTIKAVWYLEKSGGRHERKRSPKRRAYGFAPTDS